jgi:hypothetical protein
MNKSLGLSLYNEGINQDSNPDAAQGRDERSGLAKGRQTPGRS